MTTGKSKNIGWRLTLLSDLKNASASGLRKDVIAGLTVGVMIIPQGMAYAMLAGLPPIYGLYASLVPMLIYGLFGTCRQLIIGPAAMVSILIGAAVSAIVAPDSETYISLVLLISLLVGLVQWLMGFFKLGILINFLAKPVLKGFISGAAIIIFAGQIKHFVGVKFQRSDSLVHVTRSLIREIDHVIWSPFLLGMGCLTLLILLSKISRKIPGALLILVLSIALVALGESMFPEVSVVGVIPEGLPGFRMPELGVEDWKSLFSPVMTISLMSLLVSIAISKSLQQEHAEYEVDANREMRAIGLANMIGSFFHSYPVAGSFSRSAVNHETGAQTGLSSIIAAAIVALTLLFLTSFFYHLPHVTLAAIIMFSISKMIDLKIMRYLWKVDKRDFTMFLVTFLATLLLGIELGIIIGILYSLIVVLLNSTKPHFAVLGRIPNTYLFRNIDRFGDLDIDEKVLITRFDGPVYYANAPYFKERIIELTEARGEKLERLILCADSLINVDSTGIQAFEDFAAYLKSKKIELQFSGLIGPVRDIFEKSGLFDLFGRENFYLTTKEALLKTRNEDISDHNEYVLQSNNPE